MKGKILFVLYLLFALMFINAGLNKIFNYMPMPANLPAGLIKTMTAMVEIGWLMPLIAVVEVVGGVLFIIPKYRPLGAIIIFPVMIGIIITDIFNAPSALPLAIVLLVINLFVIYDNKEKYLPMIR